MIIIYTRNNGYCRSITLACWNTYSANVSIFYRFRNKGWYMIKQWCGLTLTGHTHTDYENNFPKQGEVAYAPGNGLWPMKGLWREQFVTLWLSTQSNLSKHCTSRAITIYQRNGGGAVGGTCNRLLPLLAAQMMRGRRGGRGGRKEGRRG